MTGLDKKSEEKEFPALWFRLDKLWRRGCDVEWEVFVGKMAFYIGLTGMWRNNSRLSSSLLLLSRLILWNNEFALILFWEGTILKKKFPKNRPSKYKPALKTSANILWIITSLKRDSFCISGPNFYLPQKLRLIR